MQSSQPTAETPATHGRTVMRGFSIEERSAMQTAAEAPETESLAALIRSAETIEYQLRIRTADEYQSPAHYTVWRNGAEYALIQYRYRANRLKETGLLKRAADTLTGLINGEPTRHEDTALVDDIGAYLRGA